MVKIHNKAIGTIIVLMMLSTSSLAVNYSYADNTENKVGKITKSAEQKAILTEKIVNGKLEVKRYAISESLTDADRNRMLSVEGAISGWVYVNYKTYQSGIVLYDGKASKVGDGLWKISIDDSLELEREMLDLELSDKSEGVHEIVSNDGLSYRVIFTGKMAESSQDIFANTVMNSDLSNHGAEKTIKFLQFGEIFHSENENSSIELNSIFVG